MQILIPMAGAGSRFQSAGFDAPKPFIKFNGKTMIENVIKNLGYDNDYTLVVQKTHAIQYEDIFVRIRNDLFHPRKLHLHVLDELTQGAADSCLRAIRTNIELNHPLMITNCDQMMDWNPIEFKAWFLDSGLDGAMITFDSQSPKNSYAEIDDNGFVVRTVEKEVISRHATNGVYVWRRARDFVDAAKEMIMTNLRVNNEFYVCPCYNRNISWKQKIGIYPLIGKHHPIGTPQDLVAYLDHLVGKK